MERNNSGWIKFKTKDKDHDQQLKFQEDMYVFKEVMDALPDMIVKVDTSLNVLWSNRTASQVKEDMLGRPCYEIFQGEKEACENCPCIRTLSTKHVEKGIVSLKSRNSEEETYWEITAVPQLNDQETLESVIVISRDVSDRIKTNQELQALSEEVGSQLQSFKEESEKRCGFILNLSGEVKADLEDLSEQLSDLKHHSEYKDADWLESLQQTNERILRKVGNVNDYFGMEETNIQLLYVPFEIRELVDEIYNRFKMPLKESNTTIEIVQSKGVPEKLIGDVFRLNTVMMNVIENSVKHTQNGKIKVHFYAQTLSSGKQIQLQVVVTDTGVGIPEERLNQVLEVLNTNEKRDFFDQAVQMKGLGLLTALNILKAMDGTLEVESQYGRGAVVKMTMTLGIKVEKIEAAKLDALREEEYPLEINHQVNRRRILVVEDEVVGRVTFKIHLQSHYDLIFARNGKEAVDLFMTEKPDLVFMDIMMPVMDGFEALNEIEKISRRKVPIIACTNKVIESEREYLITYGFTDYLPKPIEVSGINRIIGKYLK